MADIRLAKPAAGASESVQCAPEARFVFDFPTTDATLARDGDNLNISFEDGSKLQLQDFYKEYNEENLPSFSVDGTDVTAQDFFQAMNEPDLMPAAGPGTGTVANGARFHEWGDSALTGGIEHLNGLDWGFSRSFEWEDHPNAVGYNDDGDDEGGWRGGAVNHPVTITPENPGAVPPGTVVPPYGPENPTPPAPGTPGNHGIVPPGDVRLVSEAGLRGGGSVSVDGAMRVSAPDGLASIEVAGRVIWQNGHMVGNPEFHTDEGSFHNFAYDAAAGRLTYTYTLDHATTEHKLPGADHIAHSLPITVRDVDGDSASSSISIVIRDDVAQAVNDYNAAVEGHEVDGNVLDNDAHGADGAGAFAGGKTVRWDFPAGTREITDEDGRACHELDLKDDGGKQYGTVRLYDDGGYVFKAKSVGEGWAEGVTEFSAPAIGYAIIDADGDIAHATLNLESIKFVPGVTPNHPKPEKPEEPKPGDGESAVAAKGATIMVDEGALHLEDEEGNVITEGSGQHNEHGFKGTGTVTLDVNGEADGMCTVTLSAGGKSESRELQAAEEGTAVTFVQPVTLTVNGVDVTFTGAEYADGRWTLNYDYKLTGAQKHDQGEHNQVLGGKDDPGITVTVKDASGDQATGTVTVEVHDDIPVVSNVTGAATTVQVSMGADKADSSEKPEYLSVEVSIKDADTALEWVKADSEDGEKVKSLYNADGTFKAGKYTAESDHGTITLEVKADGSLKFGMKSSDDGKAQNVELTVKAIDADGDTASADVKLSTPSVTPHIPAEPEPNPGHEESFIHADGAAIVVDEGALHLVDEEGNITQGSGQHAEHGTSGSGTVTLEVNGEGGGKCTVTLGAGEEGVSIHLPATEEGKHETFSPAVTFTVNGVDVTFTGADYAGGQWTLNYEYNLTGDQHHDQPGHDRILGGDIPVTVTDASGDTATGTVTVAVHDDTPLMKVVEQAEGNKDLISYTKVGFKTHINFEGPKGTGKNVFENANGGGEYGLETTWTANTKQVTVDWLGGEKDGVKDKQAFWFASSGDKNSGNQTYVATSHDGAIEITPTFVHYKYVEQNGQVQVDHVVDIANSIPRSAKALYLTGEGLTLGADKTGAYDGMSWAWNGTEPGEISVGSGGKTNWKGAHDGILNLPDGSDTNGVKNFENAYGQDHYLHSDDKDNPLVDANNRDISNNAIDADNVSEAIVFDNNNGLISYGFDIRLGSFSGGDRVLLTFLMTPAHSSDDSIVKMVVLTAPTNRSDDELHRIEVPDGFTKVIVSALPKATYTVEQGGFQAIITEGTENSGFIIKEVDFLAETYTTEGQVQGTSADGMKGYAWDFADIPQNDDHKVVIVKGVGGGEYAVKIDDGKPGPGSDEITHTCSLSGGDLNGQPLFTATINTQTGKWSVTHYREFEMKNSEMQMFQIKGTDNDGDSESIPLTIPAEFMRFSNVVEGTYNPKWNSSDVLHKDQSDDILVGNDNNTLMYGKGGDDLLIGDKYNEYNEEASENFVKTLVNENPELADVEQDVLNIAKDILQYEVTTPKDDPYRDLNHVDAEGKEWCGDGTNGTEEAVDPVTGETHILTAVDKLYDDISGLGADGMKALGEVLEAHEKKTEEEGTNLHGNDALYGGGGDDLLFGAGGDDFLSGELGADIVYGGGGKDIIIYDKDDLYIDGGKGIDIIVAAGIKFDKTESWLDHLLENTGASKEDSPVVRNVELLLRFEGDFTSSLEVSSHRSLSERYGITIGENRVDLGAGWEPVSTSGDGTKIYWNDTEKLTLEVREKDGEGNNIHVELPQSDENTNGMARAAGIAVEVGLLTALAAANGVEAAPVREDGAAGAAQDAQGADGGLDAAALSYAEAVADAPAEAQPGAGEQDGFESLIADLGEVTPAMLDGAAEASDIRYTAMDADSEARPADTAAPEDGAHRAAGEGASAGTQTHGEALPEGVEAIRAGDGDDFIDGGAGSQAIYAGTGDDLIVYDPTDYLIDGGEGIDFLLAGDAQASLGQLLNEGNGENGMPIVNNVEVLLKGVDTASLTSMDKLAEKFGLTLEKGEDGQDRLMVDKSQWDAGDGPDANGVTTWTNTADANITMETTLQQTSEAEGQAVLTAKVAAETGGNN